MGRRIAGCASPGRRRRIAIVVHVYYEDTWADIAGVLSRLDLPFDLIVTTVPGRERLIERIRRDFPHAEIEVMENRGRDVRPFLTLLERGRLDRYRYVCKVHGKKSSDGGRKSYMGSLWRRRLLFDLLAAPGREPDRRPVRAGSVDRHDRSAAFRLPRKAIRGTFLVEQPVARSWPGGRRWAFAGGVPARFLWRHDVLGPAGGARALRRSCSLRFPEEQGLLDGGLEHAVERLFAPSVVAAGLLAWRTATVNGPQGVGREIVFDCLRRRLFSSTVRAVGTESRRDSRLPARVSIRRPSSLSTS